MDYKEMGFIPQALMNFIVLLGWSLDDKTDIISKTALIENFSIDRIGASPAIFDRDKLNWLNGMYIRQLDPKSFVNQALPFLSDESKEFESAYVQKVIPLVQERVKFLSEIPEATSFFFQDILDYADGNLIQKDLDLTISRDLLQQSMRTLEKTNPFHHETIEEDLRNLAKRLELKPGQLFGLIRVALTASKATPPLFTTIETLGLDRCVQRLQQAINDIGTILPPTK